MKHLSSIVLAVALIAAGATACFKDPTSSLRNGPTRIELSRSSLFVNVGDSISVQAEVKDDAGNAFDAADAVWTSSVPAVIAVTRAAATVPFDAFSRAFVRAVAPGLSWVYVTTHGLTDSVQVYGLPGSFSGAVTAPAGSMLGDTITIAGTSVVGFTDSTTVTIGGVSAYIVSQTASQLKMMAAEPVAAGSAVVLDHLIMLGVIDLSLTADTHVGVASTIRANGYSPANQDPATAPSLNLATLYTSPIIGAIDNTNVDDFWKITTPATADSVEITVSWTTDADLDIAVLNTAGGCISAQLPGSCYATMGTGNNPEVGKWRLAAATSYLINVEVYDIGSVEPLAYKVSFRKIN
jgi:hypothetical protein